MTHKDKRLENPRQYQTMIAKEWQIIVFSDEKKFKLDGPDIGMEKIFKNIITQQGIVEEDLL